MSGDTTSNKGDGEPAPGFRGQRVRKKTSITRTHRSVRTSQDLIYKASVITAYESHEIIQRIDEEEVVEEKPLHKAQEERRLGSKELYGSSNRRVIKVIVVTLVIVGVLFVMSKGEQGWDLIGAALELFDLLI